jgi:hypothetical protein
MRLVSFNAYRRERGCAYVGWPGVQGRAPGRICPDTLAKKSMT